VASILRLLALLPYRELGSKAMSCLSDFLSRNTVAPGGSLPLIHTTPAFHLREIRDGNKLIATECDVFKPDKLLYLFVGRPAYKYQHDGSEAEYWELPCCFIFEFSSIKDISRVFPFDSGAFNAGKYPPFINQLNRDDFEASEATEPVERIIGAFFGDTKSYFSLNCKDKRSFETEFSLGVFDAEIRALHRLAIEKAPSSFDDRRFSVEMQSTIDIDLRVTKPLAVVAPMCYFDDADFRSHVENRWSAAPIGYPIYTLSVAQYYGSIYERVEKFFKGRGFL
jgi:hypothetical protein